MKLNKTFSCFAVFALLVFAFQNCAPQNFTISDEALFSSLGAFTVQEDTPTDLKLQTDISNARFILDGGATTIQTQHGKVTKFDEETGFFTYVPDENYHGFDSFSFTATGDGATAQAFARIHVLPVNDLPVVGDISIQVELNKPIDISVVHTAAQDVDGDALDIWALDSSQKPTELKTGEWGKIELKERKDGQNWYRYESFSLGAHTHTFMIDDGKGGKVPFNITFATKNPLLAFKPALAVRNLACLNCHASVKGNIISDMAHNPGAAVKFHGAPGDGSGEFLYGDDYSHRGRAFFGLNFIEGTVSVPRQNLETDTASIATAVIVQGRDQNANTLPGMPTWASVPASPLFKANIPASPTTVAQYINAVLNYRTDAYLNFLKNDDKLPKDPTVTPNAKIREISSISIKAPTVAQLKQVFGADQALKYVKQGDDGTELKNFSLKDGYYTNTPNQEMECDGDLYVDGVVLLKELKLKSKYGCRIYATKTVFIDALTGATNRHGIEYIGANSHLQITTPGAVMMGTGQCTVTLLNGDTVMHRKSDERTANTPKLVDLGVITDYDKLSDGNGGHIIKDVGNCSGNTDPQRKVQFKHLLLNARAVHSRYTGDFSGVIIAEHMVGSLGKFIYKYDPIFSQVPILPLIPSNWFFSVMDCATYDELTGEMKTDTSVMVPNNPNFRTCFP